MRTDDSDLRNHLETQKTVLKIRNGMSLSNQIKFVQLSQTMRSFFNITLQILKTIKMEKDDEISSKKFIFSYDELNDENNIKMVKWNKNLKIGSEEIYKIKSSQGDQIEELLARRLDLLINKTEEILS